MLPDSLFMFDSNKSVVIVVLGQQAFDNFIPCARHITHPSAHTLISTESGYFSAGVGQNVVPSLMFIR